MPDLVYMQWLAVIDQRTTEICLHAAGQVRKVGVPFDTLNGPIEAPPAHLGCRSLVAPYLTDASVTQLAREAQTEIRRRDGEGADLAPKPTNTRRKTTLSRRG